MNPNNRDEMPEEIDFSGGVRGKYLARYQRQTSLTSASEGTVLVTSVTSKGDDSVPKLVLIVRHDTFQINRQPKIESRYSIAPEASTAAANAR